MSRENPVTFIELHNEVTRLRNQVKRMLTAFESISMSCAHMLDPARRDGPGATIGAPHTPTPDEVRDMERTSTSLDPVDAYGPWDAVFRHVVDEQYGSLDEQRRGPYATAEEAQSYVDRNPERLPGSGTVQISKSKVHTKGNPNA